jgi:integrase
MPAKQQKPDKPSAKFPLFAHASGQWAKTIRGKHHYFGVWANPQAALAEYLAQKDYLHNGVPVPIEDDRITVGLLAGMFLTSKNERLRSGEIGEHTMRDYKRTCDHIVKTLGARTLVETLCPSDFERLRASFAKTHGPSRLSKDITCARVMFKWGDDTHGIRVRYGQSFKKPSKATLRKARKRRLFTAVECRKLAKTSMRPMVLLALNAGLGNTDIVKLEWSHIDRGWLTYARPKTGIDRRVPLWPETIKALGRRGEGRVFKTRWGNPWTPETISQRFRKLKASGPFYDLRHTFATVALQVKDREAVRSIMGHVDGSVLGLYNESAPDDDRLRKAVNHVRKWLGKV